ncbi:DUF3054 domain-containing protein [Microterricola viridarii]|uniref:DUF3054 domain-containing protein n=1 Tax=Microterricola viridarii TaxID=412690 RepID=UPI0009EBF785|nr:DUF3054 domain-containing protein [Microterricola viridarii]
MSEPRSARPQVFPDLLIDLILVFAFVLIGRRSHDETFDIAGTWQTAWPFFAALLLGWLVTRAWRSPDRIWPTGVLIWLVTVAGGMALRAISGQGTDIAFVIVATLTLGAFLIGWRLLGVWIERILQKRRDKKLAAEEAAVVNAAAQAKAKAELNRPDPNRRTPGL